MYKEQQKDANHFCSVFSEATIVRYGEANLFNHIIHNIYLHASLHTGGTVLPEMPIIYKVYVLSCRYGS